MGVDPEAVGLLVTDVVGGPITAALVQSIGTPDGPLLSVRPVAPAAATARPQARAPSRTRAGPAGRGTSKRAQSSRP